MDYAVGLSSLTQKNIQYYLSTHAVAHCVCKVLYLKTRGGQVNLFLSQQIENPQILGLIPHRCESPQISNPQI